MGELGRGARRATVAGVEGRMVPVRAVRAELVPPGDLRAEVGFQNDVNALLASLEDPMLRAWTLASFPMISTPPRKRRRPPTTQTTTLRMQAFGAEREDLGSVPLALMP